MAIWYILCPFWYIFWLFGMYIFPVLECCSKKNLATLFTGSFKGKQICGRATNTLYAYFRVWSILTYRILGFKVESQAAAKMIKHA
jgi:hypothetical protein